MKAVLNIYKGSLLFLLFFILLPPTIIVYIVGFLEMLGSGIGSGIDGLCETVTVVNFEAFRTEMHNRIKKI